MRPHAPTSRVPRLRPHPPRRLAAPRPSIRRAARTATPRVALLAAAAALLAAAPAVAGERRAGERIVGGAPVAITRAPYQAAIYDPTLGGAQASPFLGQFCGGAILDATHVATAAHCVFDQERGTVRPVSRLRVLAGVTRLRRAGEPEVATARDAGVRSVAIRPGFVLGTLDGDAAVLTLDAPLYTGTPVADGTTAIAPIAPVTPEQAALVARTGDPVTVTGWGNQAPQPEVGTGRSDYPQTLQAATTHVVDDGSCARAYARVGVRITRRVLCAGERAGGVDACQGDSGGPLTALVGGTPALVGIVSLGSGCAQANRPGLYARIADPAVGGFVRHAAGLGGDAPDAGSSSSDPRDAERPTSRVAAQDCGRTRCVVNVAVTDPLPSTGVRRVAATLRWRTPVACRTRARRCGRTHAQRLTAEAIGGANWGVTAKGLRPGRRYTLTLRAEDGAGNRQRRATRVTLRPGA
nr:serine protease [Patulibacter sp. SYSU D01012]